MKRCPQCEFIYEDDQSLCDMDGVLLVLDSRTLPNAHALTTVPAKSAPRRNRAVPAFATVILALVLGMVYYVSMQRSAAPGIDIPASAASTTIPAPEVKPSPEVTDSEAIQAPAPEEPKPAPEERKPVPVKQPAAVPSRKAAAAVQTTSKTEPKKEDSKVNSLLKKTGRILKKPFKF